MDSRYWCREREGRERRYHSVEVKAEDMVLYHCHCVFVYTV
jgi:hypothetical protein